MSRIRNFILVIIFVIFLIVFSGDGEINSSYLPENIEIPSPSVVYPYALEEAYRWYEEPFLSGVSIVLGNKRITYYFKPSRKASRFLNVYAFLGEDELRIETSGEHESSVVLENKFEVNFDEIIDIKDAYRIAFEVWGEHFFRISLDPKPRVLISLDQLHSKETLQWGISFIDNELGSVIVELDAYTGDIMDVRMSKAFKED